MKTPRKKEIKMYQVRKGAAFALLAKRNHSIPDKKKAANRRACRGNS